jgi:hypothetical protein
MTAARLPTRSSRFGYAALHHRAVLRRLVIAGGLLVAAALLVYGASQKADAPPLASQLDPAVEALTPDRGSTSIRQAEIGIDLQPGWTGDLIINGIDIPEDQLRRNDPLNQFYFQPGAGKEISALKPGVVTVSAIIWRPLDGGSRDHGSHSVTWGFTAA